MVASLGLDPVVLLKGGPEGLQPYTAYGSQATHNLQSTQAAAGLQLWLVRGALGAPQGATQSEQLSSSLPSHAPDTKAEKGAHRAAGGNQVIRLHSGAKQMMVKDESKHCSAICCPQHSFFRN